MGIVLAAASALGALAGAAPADLDSVLLFAAPAACRHLDPLATIVGRMALSEWRRPAALPPIPVPGYAEPVTPRIRLLARTGIVDLDLPGTWNGLNVIRLRRSFARSGARQTFQIHFSARPEQVRAALNRAGFQLGPTGTSREVYPGNPIRETIGVEPIAG